MRAELSQYAKSGPGERGSALLATFVALFFLMSLSIGLMAIVRPSVQIAANQERDTRALYVAEAGVQEVIERMSLDSPNMLTVNGGTFNAAVRDSTPGLNPNWRVRIFNASPAGVGALGAAPVGETYSPTVQASTDWLAYASANNPAEALMVEHKWVDVDTDGLREAGEMVKYDRTKYPPENFTTGFPVEVISVLGKNGPSRRGLRVEVTRLPINPNLNAAMLCDRGVDVRGNVFVDGHNHSADTPVNTVDPACQAWELDAGRTDESRCATGIMTTGDPVDRDGSTDLLGTPTVMDTSTTNPFLTLAETLGLTDAELAEVLSHADYHSSNDAAYLSGVTFVNGNATGSERFNNVAGDGLLYVKGNLATSGTFTWKGLVYVEGDFTNSGTPWILGAVVVKGVSSYAFGGGTPDILFSRDAVYLFVSRGLGYTVLAWKRT
jgi:hypothetical protein